MKINSYTDRNQIAVGHIQGGQTSGFGQESPGFSLSPDQNSLEFRSGFGGFSTDYSGFGNFQLGHPETLIESFTEIVNERKMDLNDDKLVEKFTKAITRIQQQQQHRT